MSKRTKLKRAARTHGKGAQGKGAVHDRRAQELPANAMVAPVEVEGAESPVARKISHRQWNPGTNLLIRRFWD